jgi:mono/diheme cytochrome c family protein
MKHPKHILQVGAFLGLSFLAASCGQDPNNPGMQYSPEMYEAIPYEPFRQVRDSISPFANLEVMQTPPSGTVPRGGYLEGFELAGGDSMRTNPEVIAYPNPIPPSDTNLKQGQVLYERFCAVCHGKKGKGDGPVTKNAAIKPNPYDGDKLKNYTDGQIYHTMMYGQGVMGSYTSQIQYEDRWKIVHYVKTLQGNKTVAPDSAAVDTAAMAPVVEQPAPDKKNNHR